MATRYLEKYGTIIANNGYEVIPIVPGEKRPFGERWQKYDGSAEGVTDHVTAGRGAYGCGIKTKHAPAIDLDILDIAVLDELKDMVREIVGESPLKRIGFAPKELWVFRTEDGKPFPKVDTGRWLDKQNRFCKVEILADGQQFVAAHIHPDTRKPYRWLDGVSVLNTPLIDLPTLSHAQATEIKERSLSIFLSHGWVKESKSLITRLNNPLTDDDNSDPFAAYRPKVQISDEELERKLFQIKDNADHEIWFQIGMALYHQYDGNDFGFGLWNRWSSSAANYDEKALLNRWPSFDNKDRAHIPMTCRIILKLAKGDEVESMKLKTAEIMDSLNALTNTAKIDTLLEICTKIKIIDFDSAIRELITGKVKACWRIITGETPRISFIRELTRYESKEIISAPPWVKPWVYCYGIDRIFNIVNRTQISRESFNVHFAREMLSQSERMEGKTVPEILPLNAAMNLYQIPSVYNRMFMPGQPVLYSLEGVDYANSYTEEGIPELPGVMSPVEEEAVQIFLHHFEHLFSSHKDRTLFLDFITYIVKNPGQRVNWAILIQGSEGDGKSWFSLLLKSILGDKNVNDVSGKALEEKYNGWAEGALVCFIEEVRLQGANRFDAINNVKTLLTNKYVSIRVMNTDPYSVINTMNYIMTSNFKDAMPVGDEDSRVFPLFSRFQNKRMVDDFKRENPQYYNRLHGALHFAGAIRQYLLLREYSPLFDPKNRAPESDYRDEMVMLNRSEELTVLIECLAESQQPDFSEFLLDSRKMIEHFMGTDALPPRGKALNRLLSQHGFTLLGRFQMGDIKTQYWTMNTQYWPTNNHTKCAAMIREYLDPDSL